jgi:hypothetical protein
MKKLILIVLFATGMGSQTFAQAFTRNNLQPAQHESISPVQAVFPNPATSNTSVLLSQPAQQRVYVDLVDQKGHIVTTYVFAPGGRQLTFDVGFLEGGYYILRVREPGRYVSAVRLVKTQ